MEVNKRLTVWFGKEVPTKLVKKLVHDLQSKGYDVQPTFYIGYDIDDGIVKRYLHSSLDNSDSLYVIGNTGSLLEDIVNYAEKTNKTIVRKEIVVLCGAK